MKREKAPVAKGVKAAAAAMIAVACAVVLGVAIFIGVTLIRDGAAPPEESGEKEIPTVEKQTAGSASTGEKQTQSASTGEKQTTETASTGEKPTESAPTGEKQTTQTLPVGEKQTTESVPGGEKQTAEPALTEEKTTDPPPTTVPPVTDPPPTTVPPVTFHESQKWEKAVEKWNSFVRKNYYGLYLYDATGTDGADSVSVRARIGGDYGYPEFHLRKTYWDFILSADGRSLLIEGTYYGSSAGDMSQLMRQAASFLSGEPGEYGVFATSNWRDDSGGWTEIGDQTDYLKKTKTDHGMIFTIQYQDTGSGDPFRIEVKKTD